MTEQAKEARRAYLRKWAKAHPDKIREYQARHWQKVADSQKLEEPNGNEENDQGN